MIGIDGLRRAAAVGSAVLALAAALAGCGKVASDDSVEEQIKAKLGTDTVDCPSDLKGEVGQSIVCTATQGDAKFDVKVTVTSVEGNTINFDIEKVGAAPTSAPSAPETSAAASSAPAAGTGADVASSQPSATVSGKNVAQSVFDQLTEGRKQVDKVTCPDLAARVGASERCTLVSGSQSYGVTVTVTSVQGTDVKFDIQVDKQPQ